MDSSTFGACCATASVIRRAFSKHRNQLAAIAAGGIAMLCVCWWRLLLRNLIPVDGNVIAVSYPNWVLAKSVWREPRLLFWNPMRSMGTPHLADPITSALYPPLWLLSLLPDYPSFLRAWVVLHSLISAGFLAALVYRWKKSPAAAAGAAALGAFNGFFMARVVFPHCFASQAWLPAVLFFQEIGSPVGIGICLALQWLAGYPTYSLITGAAALAWSLRRGRRGLVNLAKGGAIALGLAAAQLLPFLEFLSLSSRGFAVNPDFAGQFSVPPLQLLKEIFVPLWMSINPEVAGDPAMATFYTGLPAVVLAIWAAWRGRRTERGLAIASLCFFVLTLGKYLPGFSAVPFSHLFRSPSNWLLPATIATSLLAAAGIARFKSSVWGWAAAVLIALDLALFAQPVKSAWSKPTFLTDVPFVAQTVDSWPRPIRIFHTRHLMETWGRGKLENEEDYLLMRDYLAPSYGMAFGLGDASNYQTLRLASAEHYRLRLGNTAENSPLLDWAGINLVIFLDERAQRVERPYLHLRRNPNAKSRVFLLESDRGKVAISHYSPGKIRAELELEKPQTVVLSEMDYPGWRVRVDGKSTRHQRFEDAFVSVVLPPGHHVVDFRFNPWSFWFGLLISLATIGGLVLRRQV